MKQYFWQAHHYRSRKVISGIFEALDAKAALEQLTQMLDAKYGPGNVVVETFNSIA